MIAAAASSGLAVISTFTRGAWLGVLIQGAVVLILWQKRRGLKWLAGLVIAFLILSSVVPVLRERIESFGNTKSNSISQRYELWNANWNMFLDHPILGVGARRNSMHVEEYNQRLYGKRGFVADAHNSYLQVLAGTGFLGFSFWLFIMGYFLVQSMRGYFRAHLPQDKAVQLGAVGAQVIFHVGGFTQATFVDSEVLIFYVFVIAFSVVNRRSFYGFSFKIPSSS
jgi:O-antigen ligase